MLQFSLLKGFFFFLVLVCFSPLKAEKPSSAGKGRRLFWSCLSRAFSADSGGPVFSSWPQLVPAGPQQWARCWVPWRGHRRGTAPAPAALPKVCRNASPALARRLPSAAQVVAISKGTGSNTRPLIQPSAQDRNRTQTSNPVRLKPVLPPASLPQSSGERSSMS
jgi:hypothetical protein